MAVVLPIFLLFVGVCADQFPFDNHKGVRPESLLTSVSSENAGSGCDFPFERVGQSCYFFSDMQKTFPEAEHFCQSLKHGHGYEVDLAMFGYDRNEDQALSEAIVMKNSTYWVGGMTEDGANWTWIDNRDISLLAPFWHYSEPNGLEKQCTISKVTSFGNNIRSYLYANACNDSFNFICEAELPLYFEFRRIGKHYYFLSKEADFGEVNWQNARDYCQSMAVLEGYHSDLAVLGMADQDDYQLMSSFLVGFSGGLWLGAYAETDCDYKWIDGRPLNISSIYWKYSQPTCGMFNRVSLGRNADFNRGSLSDFKETTTSAFICQMFKDA